MEHVRRIGIAVAIAVAVTGALAISRGQDTVYRIEKSRSGPPATAPAGTKAPGSADLGAP